MAHPPSLGDVQPNEYKVIRETVPLPNGRKAIVSAVSAILDKGGVQKVVIELGQPIKVNRAVMSTELPEAPEEAPEEDVMAAVRNGEIVDMTATADETGRYNIFWAFHLLSSKGKQAKMVLFNSKEAACEFFDVGKSFDLTEAYGVPIRVSKEVPEDVALLVGSGSDEGSFVNLFAVRIPLSRSQTA